MQESSVRNIQILYFARVKEKLNYSIEPLPYQRVFTLLVI